jgi:hypothetical protein
LQIITGCGSLVKKKHNLGYDFRGLGTRYGGSRKILNSKSEYLISEIINLTPTYPELGTPFSFGEL